MSDPRSFFERRLPLFGIALLVEVALVALPPIATIAVKGTGTFAGASTIPFVLGHLVFPGLLAVLVLAMHRRTTSTAFLRSASLVALAGNELSLAGWSYLGTPRTLALCEPLSSILITLSLPVLWGSAVIRLRDPGNASLQATGRKAAGLLQLAFIFRFAGRFQQIRNFASLGSIEASYAVWSLVEIAESLILLWASVESVRSTPDADAVRDRAARIHKLLRAWFVVLAVGSAVTNAVSLASSSDPVIGMVYQSLSMVTYLTLNAAAVGAVARHCSARIGPVQFPASETPTDRSGGVESTGESS